MSPQTVPESSSNSSTSSDNDISSDVLVLYNDQSPQNIQQNLNMAGRTFNFEPRKSENMNLPYNPKNVNIRNRPISFLMPKSESTVSETQFVPTCIPQANISHSDRTFNVPVCRPQNANYQTFMNQQQTMGIQNFNNNNSNVFISEPKRTVHMSPGMFSPTCTNFTFTGDNKSIYSDVGRMTHVPVTMYKSGNSSVTTCGTSTYPHSGFPSFALDKSVNYCSSGQIPPTFTHRTPSASATCSQAFSPNSYTGPANLQAGHNILSPTNQAAKSDFSGMSDVLRQAYTSINAPVTTSSAFKDEYSVPSISTLPTVLEEFEYESL